MDKNLKPPMLISFNKDSDYCIDVSYVKVQIVGGEVLHSKKNGDGYIDSQAKMDKIFAGVEKALESA